MGTALRSAAAESQWDSRPSVSAEVEVKLAVRFEVVKVKFAVGGWFGALTVTFLLIESVAPSLSVTVS